MSHQALLVIQLLAVLEAHMLGIDQTGRRLNQIPCIKSSTAARQKQVSEDSG